MIMTIIPIYNIANQTLDSPVCIHVFGTAVIRASLLSPLKSKGITSVSIALLISILPFEGIVRSLQGCSKVIFLCNRNPGGQLYLCVHM